MICKKCGKEFEPSKNDARIVFCSTDCRIEFRRENGYMSKYYSENTSKWKETQATDEYKKSKNEARRIKYAEDKEYREKTKEKVKLYNEKNPHIKHAQRLSAYGLTPEMYDGLLKNQNYKCAICGEEQNAQHRNKLYVDHNHETGKVRGLLCNNCNFAIGHLKDDIQLLKNAIKYLEDNNG